MITAWSFAAFLSIFVLIGLSSLFFNTHQSKDYYLASNTVKPWLVGLSAVATNNSGYMFIGVIGYTYTVGLSAFWVMVGWIFGDFLASHFVHKKLRGMTEKSGEVSYLGVLANWNGSILPGYQRLAALICLLLLTAYAAAQLLAGSKALHVLFDWPTWAGAVCGAVLVAVYCLAGGIRASIWTDAAQSVVMITAMGILMWVAIANLGGVSATVSALQDVPNYMDWFPEDLAFPGVPGAFLFALGWLFAGLSVVGQPHVMVRFMALSSGDDMNRARAWYYLWFTAFYLMATTVGLLSRLYLPEVGSFDAELALPTMAQTLLPPVLVGLILAGIFAATLSTADSLILSSSAAFTHDLMPNNIERPFLIKASTLGVCILALGWALLSAQSVFAMVVMAWSGLASAFVPMLAVLIFGGRPSQGVAIAMSCVGIATALAWRYFDLHNMVYEGLPGIFAGVLVYWLAKPFVNKAGSTAGV
ncbi:MAG: sodium/proline symporter [Gammaproteobacteria bacterium]|nr:sodium/proline symporter [Gammaproteobacteria bacterium]MBU1832607.1 sodium/proline symporter [Gammaproteobacteria bacterium]